ncbi:hypothetical protein [Okeania sp. KiyG1]|uniref:hypothetical protein n=1 Tax=Okeania sp. KiyG1 TaxID=2720165 RepID=UPI001922EA95|nr:hypothetical protein [Okeania sp. KiyG1]
MNTYGRDTHTIKAEKNYYPVKHFNKEVGRMATPKNFHPINTSIYLLMQKQCSYRTCSAKTIFTTKEKSSSCEASKKTARYFLLHPQKASV